MIYGGFHGVTGVFKKFQKNMSRIEGFEFPTACCLTYMVLLIHLLL